MYYSITYYHLESSVLCSCLGCFPCAQTVLGLILIPKLHAFFSEKDYRAPSL